MAGGATIVRGQGRFPLVARTDLSITGSTDLGTFDASRFARFAGLFSVIGSVTVQYRLGISSDAFQVTSSFVVNSGAAVFDVINYGRYVNFALSAANSQVLSALIYGEPIR